MKYEWWVQRYQNRIHVNASVGNRNQKTVFKMIAEYPQNLCGICQNPMKAVLSEGIWVVVIYLISRICSGRGKNW